MAEVKERPRMEHAGKLGSRSAEPDYETDFSEWSFRQAELARSGAFAALDLANVIEELESMGNEQRRALMSSYRVLMTHLLKWRFQQERRSRSWENTIGQERDNIIDRETINHSLAKRAQEIVEDVYPRACKKAAFETRLPVEAFPAECPFTLAQLRDDEFLPD